MGKEELLELIRKERPGQVIHEVKDFRPHPLRNFGVEYEVDVVMENNFFNKKIINISLPYPIEPYLKIQKEWGKRYGVYEKTPQHQGQINGIILAPYNNKEEAEEDRQRYGYNTDNYYVDELN